MEKTLVILKPDSVSRGIIGSIIDRFERKGLKVVGLQMKRLPQETVETHYSEHASKPFFGELCGFMTGGPVVVIAVEGPRAITVTRKLVGATAGFDAEPGTIRGDFSLSNQSNLIHASDSPESSERELALFFDPAHLVEHSKPDEIWW